MEETAQSSQSSPSTPRLIPAPAADIPPAASVGSTEVKGFSPQLFTPQNRPLHRSSAPTGLRYLGVYRNTDTWWL